MQSENQESQPNQPSPSVSMSGAGQKPGFTSTRKGKIITIVVVLVVLLLLAVLLAAIAAHNKSGNSGVAKDSASLYVKRDGYNPQKLSKGTADPEALIMNAKKPAVTYDGKAIIQACNVLSLDAIHQLGVHLYPNPLAVVVDRTYFDGQGKGKLDLDPYSLPLDTATNSCDYGLADGVSLELTVFQPNYVPDSAVTDALHRYTKQAPINGADVYADKADETLRYYIIHTNGMYLQMNLVSSLLDKDSSLKPDDFLKQAAAKVINNLAVEAKDPSGPPKITYDSPIFKKSYANGCDLLTADDFKSINGEEAGPLVREKSGSGVGVVSFRQTTSDKNSYAYIDNACQRDSILGGVGVGTNGSIKINQTHVFVTTESFTQDQPAKLSYDAVKASSKNVTSATSTKIGDEAMFGDRVDQKKALTFRKGRFVISISNVDVLDKPTISDSEIIKKLTPVAQRIANKLGSLE